MKYLKIYEELINNEDKANYIAFDVDKYFFKYLEELPHGAEAVDINYKDVRVLGEYKFFIEVEIITMETIKAFKNFCDFMKMEIFLESEDDTIFQTFTVTYGELDKVLEELEIFKTTNKYNI